MTRSPMSSVLFAVFALGAAGPVQADGPELGLNASAGYRYDGNVSLPATDTNAGEGDSALLLNLHLEGAVPLTDNVSLRLNYGYRRTTYSTFSAFDLAIHHANVALRYDVAGFDSGLSFARFTVRADGGHFLDIRQASPSLGRRIGQKLYLRGSFTRQEKDFAGGSDRGAVNRAVRGDAYLLVDGMEKYVALAYRIAREDAQAAAFDYKGREARVTYRQQLQAGRVTVDWKTYLQIESRSYGGTPDPDAAPRRDERLRTGMNAAIPVSERIAVRGELEYVERESNHTAANFDEIVYGISVAVDL